MGQIVYIVIYCGYDCSTSTYEHKVNKIVEIIKNGPFSVQKLLLLIMIVLNLSFLANLFSPENCSPCSNSPKQFVASANIGLFTPIITSLRGNMTLISSTIDFVFLIPRHNYLRSVLWVRVCSCTMKFSLSLLLLPPFIFVFFAEKVKKKNLNEFHKSQWILDFNLFWNQTSHYNRNILWSLHPNYWQNFPTLANCFPF